MPPSEPKLSTKLPAEAGFARLVEIMARLRAPGGCPWDREQTFETIKPYLLEETYEVLDAIDARDWDGLAGELGDLLLQVVFFSQMAKEAGYFDVTDAIEAINSKLVRRHPHVFADGDAKTSDEVLRKWDEIKTTEKKERPKGLLAGVPSSLPALIEASKIASRAAGAGFDWNNVDEVLEKLREELAELDGARKAGSQEALQDEIGDLLFVIVNIARFLKVDPEQALRGTNSKFRRRFAHVEQGLEAQGKSPKEASIEEMERLWQEAKIDEKKAPRLMIVRALSGHAEFAEAVRLQREIWGFPDLELLPVRFFVVASRIGGQTLGAFDGSRMAGFLLAIPGIKKDTGTPYLHSHMLGVLPDYRDAGVGRMLKSAQREDALARGFPLIEWSFDPFEAKNAYFNMEVLGAMVRTYVPDMYGISTSPLHGDLPTDRCIAEWWIAEPPTKAQGVARVSLPSQKTRESQESLGRELQQHFADGLAVTGFERSGDSGTYLLSPWPSK